MPIYDYKCQECEKISEIFVRNPGSEVTKCPECGSENMERIISFSYMIRMATSTPGTTCCGRTERCQKPPCSTDDVCPRE